MKRITLARTFLTLAAVGILSASQNPDKPAYVAVELNLDGAIRDAGATVSTAIAANEQARVGAAPFEAHTHAMIWKSEGARSVDLHAFLPKSFTDSAATGIDEAGNITGVAIDSGRTAHDILWKPTFSQSVILASGGSGSGGGGGGSTSTIDKVSITRALWFSTSLTATYGELLVQATSSRQDAVLTMTDTTTGEVIATLPNIGGGKYGGTVLFRFQPSTSVTVTSNFGGVNTRAVIPGVQ